METLPGKYFMFIVQAKTHVHFVFQYFV